MTDRRDPVWLLLEQWARVSPEFLAWWTRTLGVGGGGAMRIPIDKERIPAALAALKAVPDAAGERAVRAALIPFWEASSPGPFEPGV